MTGESYFLRVHFYPTTSPVAGVVLNAGSQSLSVTAAATTNYNTATKSVTLQVNPASQTITFGALADKTYGDAPFALSATATSGLAVTFAVANGPATYDASTSKLTITGAGAVTVTASQAGNTNYSAATPGSRTFNVVKANQSITVTTPAPASAVYNTTFTVAATSTSGLPVSYTSAGTLTNSGATYTMTSGTGTGTVTYNAAGDANYNAAPTLTTTVNAAKADQAITIVTPSPASAIYNTTFTVGATASSGLAVAYTSTAPLTNTTGATFKMTSGVGTGVLTYSQAGNDNYNAALSLTADVAAAKANQAITIVTPSPASATYNTTFTVAASSSLPVTYSSAGTLTNSGALYTMTSGTGSGTVTYNAAGDANYNPAPTLTATVTAAKASQAITIVTASPTSATYNTSFTVGATASSGLPVTYSSAGVLSNVGALYTMTSGTGSGTVKYNATGNDNYNAAPELTATVTAAKADAVVTVTGYGGTYDAQAHGATGTATGVGGGSLAGLNLGASFTNAPGGTATWTFTGGTNYNDQNGSAAITIGKKAASVSPLASSKTYGGTEPTLSGSLLGFLTADGVTAAYSRTSGETVGSYTISAVLSPAAVLTNYDITYNTAVFAINTRAITVAATTGQGKVYGGTEPTLTYNLTAGTLASGDAFAGSLTRAAGENVGSAYAITQGGLVIMKGTADVTSNYNLTFTGANFAIMAKAITGSFAADNKTYDGNTSATVLSRSLSGVIGTEAVTLTGGTATFADANKGTGKVVTLAGASLAGTATAVANYTLTSVATTTAAIAAKALTASFTASNKVYDGNTSATIATRSLSGVIPADASAVSLGTSGTATFASAGVADGKTVTGTGFALSGTAAGNYSLNTTTATTSADITAKALLVSATGINKPYDGNTTATVTLSDNRVSGDVLTTAYTGAVFADANIGTDKTVAVTGISITGTDAGNYTANTVTTTKANITAATTSIAVVNNGPVQYSDKVTFTATLTSATAQSVLNSTGGTVEFKLTSNGSTVSLGSSAYPGDWSMANGTVTKDFVLTQKPGTYTVTAIFTPNSGNITGVTNATTAGSVVVNLEDATLVYSGLEYFGTANSTSSTANVEYITTVTDAADGFRGNITNARAAFLDASTSTAQFGTSYAVLANSPTDATVGTARTGVNTVTLTTGEFNNGGKTIDLITVAQGDYYTGRTTEHTLITIAVPGQDYVNGGGNVVVTQSSGTYAATAGSKMNFGFTMKWNKSGKNIQGQANIIFRRLVGFVWRTYQIKSNAINTLGTTSTSAGNQGDFNTKANMTDITDPLAPLTMGGALDLSVQAFESTVTGSAHKIGITLRDASGVLMFSNNWTGAKTDMQPLNGGKISVLSTNVSAATSITQAVAVTAAAMATAVVADASRASAPTSNLLEVYPTPLVSTGTIHFHTTEGGKAQVYVYDQVGRLVTTLYNAEVESGQEYYLPLSAEKMAEGVYSCRLIVNGKVENKRFNIQH